MKLFEIEVVRTYTTTIEVALPDNLTPRDVERLTSYDLCYLEGHEHLADEIWDILGEKELEQCDTDMAVSYTHLTLPTILLV